MTTGTIYDTVKHEFEGLPNTPSTCRYCKQSFTNTLHQQPAPDSAERWITREEAAGHAEMVRPGSQLNRAVN